jgi:hypothetical protein
LTIIEPPDQWSVYSTLTKERNTKMRKYILSAVVAGSLFASTFAGAVAAQPASDRVPGTPGDANCLGQTMAWAAQYAKGPGDINDINPGIGNWADFAGLSNQELKANVEAYCNP